MVYDLRYRKFLMPCGLKNKGNTCFFNAVIQSMLSLSSFVLYFKSNVFNNEKQPFSYAFKEFIFDYQNNKIYDPEILINILSKRIKLFDGNQQDAHCFLELFLSILIEEQENENKLLGKIFKIVNEDLVKCQKCDFIKIVQNEMNDRSLFIEDSVIKSLNSYIKKTDIVSKDSLWLCPKCNKTNQASINHKITETSDIFIIYLHRFEGINRKNKKEIEIDNEITILNNVYEIGSIVCHDGRLNSGHYYTKGKRNNIWYEFNDSIITKTDFSFIKSTPYLLFYTKK